jgi:hypothetical protein
MPLHFTVWPTMWRQGGAGEAFPSSGRVRELVEKLKEKKADVFLSWSSRDDDEERARLAKNQVRQEGLFLFDDCVGTVAGFKLPRLEGCPSRSDKAAEIFHKVANSKNGIRITCRGCVSHSRTRALLKTKIKPKAGVHTPLPTVGTRMHGAWRCTFLSSDLIRRTVNEPTPWHPRAPEFWATKNHACLIAKTHIRFCWTRVRPGALPLGTTTWCLTLIDSTPLPTLAWHPHANFSLLCSAAWWRGGVHGA